MTLQDFKNKYGLSGLHSQPTGYMKFEDKTEEVFKDVEKLLAEQKESIKNKIKPEITDHLTCGNDKCFYDGEWCYHLTDKEFNSWFE